MGPWSKQRSLRLSPTLALSVREGRIRFTAEGEAAVEAGPETMLACDAGVRLAVEALGDAVCLISVATGG
jgi:hypothetical protein